MNDRTALYRVFDGEDVLLYVGISHHPFTRWTEHAKDKPWWSDVASLSLEWHSTRAEAELAERKAMSEEKPLHNLANSPWRSRVTPSGRLEVVARRGPLRNRVIRVEDELWDEFGELCAAEGTNRSEALRAFMQEAVDDWRAAHRQDGAA